MLTISAIVKKCRIAALPAIEAADDTETIVGVDEVNTPLTII